MKDKTCQRVIFRLGKIYVFGSKNLPLHFRNSKSCIFRLKLLIFFTHNSKRKNATFDGYEMDLI